MHPVLFTDEFANVGLDCGKVSSLEIALGQKFHHVEFLPPIVLSTTRFCGMPGWTFGVFCPSNRAKIAN
jgi:hypothetical protein